MLKIILPFLLLTFIELSSGVYGQQNNNEDFIADLNGNGIPDRIVKIEHKKPFKRLSWIERTKCEMATGHFAKFVLYLDNQKDGKVIFDYLIGDEEAQYWQYRIDKAVDLNNDGVKDLIFYAGDDTTEEYVFLIQKQNFFKAVYSGTLELDKFAEPNKANDIIVKPDHKSPKIFAKWNPKSEIFEGRNIKWITEDCVGMYAEPNNKSNLLHFLAEGWIIESFGRQNDLNGWQQIKIRALDNQGEVELQGWIEMRYLSAISPTKIFPIY